MKIVTKILKLASIVILTLLVILFAAARLMQDRVADIILKSLNDNISTKLHVGTFRLSFLSKFPKASLELRNVFVQSSPAFNAGSFGIINTDTLLAARNVSIEFKLTDILFGNYTVERIRARTGKMNFFTDNEGKVNYDISTGRKKSGSRDFTIDLRKVYLSDIKTYYNNLATRLIIHGAVSKGTLKSIIHGDYIGFSADGEVQIDSIQLYSTSITKRIPARLDIDLQKTKNGITFRKGLQRIDNYEFGLDGTISSENIYDLKITGHNIDISRIRHHLPDKYTEMLSEYDLRGIIVIDSKIKGLMTRTANPHVEVNFSLDKGQITYRKSDLKISNLKFDGYYTNGSKNRPETGAFKIRTFSGKAGSADYTGSFSLSGFDNPAADLTLKGKAIPGEIKEFFGLDNIYGAGGSVDADIRLSGRIDLKKKFGLSDLINLKTEGTMTFNSFSIGLNNKSLLVTDVNGNLAFDNSILARNLKFIYKGQ